MNVNRLLSFFEVILDFKINGGNSVMLCINCESTKLNKYIALEGCEVN